MLSLSRSGRWQASLDWKGFRSLAATTPAEQVERVNAFDMYERGLVEHVGETFRPPWPNRNRSLQLKVGENRHFWVREVELAMDAALILTERLRIAFALSNVGGCAKTWAYTRESTSPGCFTSWAQL
ncbi:Gag Polyprotein [Phytophthora megakarya]|uniref:Gag Polyprotein n=1 Tax=Phytophthora megakarya TaxID=4795 RepID=A0A225WN09_9STRA|nr:Gag Polyprotein [Phytophthora megakarya]